MLKACYNNTEHICRAVLIRPGTLKLLVEEPCCCSIQKYESPCAWITILHSTQKETTITYCCCTISEHHLYEWDELPWLVESGASSFGKSTNHGYTLLYWTASDFKEGGGGSTPSQPLALPRNTLPTTTFPSYLFTLWCNLALGYERNPQP